MLGPCGGYCLDILILAPPGSGGGSLAWIAFPGQIVPIMSQDSVSPIGSGRLDCFSSSNTRLQAVSLQPLPSSQSIPLPSLYLDHTFTRRVAGIKFSPALQQFWCQSFGTPW